MAYRHAAIHPVGRRQYMPPSGFFAISTLMSMNLLMNASIGITLSEVTPRLYLVIALVLT
jgi:hypothetical protein